MLEQRHFTVFDRWLNSDLVTELIDVRPPLQAPNESGKPSHHVLFLQAIHYGNITGRNELGKLHLADGTY